MLIIDVRGQGQKRERPAENEAPLTVQTRGDRGLYQVGVVNVVNSGLIYEHSKEHPPSSAHLTLNTTLEKEVAPSSV